MKKVDSKHPLLTLTRFSHGVSGREWDALLGRCCWVYRSLTGLAASWMFPRRIDGRNEGLHIEISGEMQEHQRDAKHVCFLNPTL